MIKGSPEVSSWTLNSNTTFETRMDLEWLRKRENVSSRSPNAKAFATQDLEQYGTGESPTRLMEL
jgi:hypothetical protein